METTMSFKQNKLAQIFLGAVLSLLLLSTSQAADSDSKYAAGFQSTGYSYGLSGKMEISDEITAQGIIGLFGDLSSYSVRGLYNLKSDTHWDAYAYGSAGMWSYDSSFDDFDENVFVFGSGVGIEYDWRAFAPELPPVYWNLELGLNVGSFDYYDFSALSFGVGAHYRF
jgi:hypothetical protein